ncbi:MAG: hypothetical protein M0024_01085 [Nitrospiraceae bacterium]|nr:hypothetical protein [Nitrospiraceae bacterium]
MHVVALHSLREPKESSAGALASALGATVYEALARLRTPGNGPVVAAVFSDRERADQLAERLRSAGFSATVVTEEEITAEEDIQEARRFSLKADQLGVTSVKGDSLSIPFGSVELILRGTAIVQETSTETTKTRKISAERAILSGGMSMTKTVKTVREVTTEERQGFFRIYAGEALRMVFFEKGLVYDSLGSEQRHSRAANFGYLVAELRRLCPQAVYDERLLTRAGQAGLLGPSLTPEKHISAAAALLAKVLRGMA